MHGKEGVQTLFVREIIGNVLAHTVVVVDHVSSVEWLVRTDRTEVEGGGFDWRINLGCFISSESSSIIIA